MQNNLSFREEHTVTVSGPTRPVRVTGRNNGLTVGRRVLVVTVHESLVVVLPSVERMGSPIQVPTGPS